MTLKELFDKGFGLNDIDTYSRIRWFETTAKESGLVESPEEEDYDCLGLSTDDSYSTVYYNADAVVEIVDEDTIQVQATTGAKVPFTLYRPAKTSELL